MSLNIGIIASSRTASGEAPIVTSGLVAHYDAGNASSYSGSGSTWNDISGNSLTATLISSPTYSSLNGGSLLFNGSTQYATIGHNTLFNFSTQLTISFWVKTSSNFNAYLTTKGENSFFFGIGPSGQTSGKASLFLSGTSGSWAQSVATVSSGSWINIVATWNGTNTIFYINGILDSTYARPGTLTTGTSAVNIAYRSTPSLNGNISIVMYYNRAINATEVLQNFNARKARYGL